MGKKQHSKDRLFITQTEHKYLYGGKKEEVRRAYKRLPFNCCAITLSPFSNPVATRQGHLFDLEAIVPYIKQHQINPVNGAPLALQDLIRLHVSKNSQGEYMCPVTYKVFTNNSKIAAIATSGNVYAYDAIEELNLKPKNWNDLVSGERFTRKDIIVLQDPQDLSNREIENFEHFRRAKLQGAAASQGGEDAVGKTIRTNAATDRILQELEAKRREKQALREKIQKGSEDVSEKDRIVASLTHSNASGNGKVSEAVPPQSQSTTTDSEGIGKPQPKLQYSKFTVGECSRSFTSSSMAPVTANRAAVASTQELLEKRWQTVRKMKQKGIVRLDTTHGYLDLEIHCDFVPQTADNFMGHCRSKYYKDVLFHRVISGFMMQGGDPSGTGRGGESIWKKPFRDEIDSRLSHDARGVLSMANAGPVTNRSQFFITFKACTHLDKKHSVFGRVIGGMETLDRIEQVPTGADDRPLEDIRIRDVQIFANPFEEYEIAEAEGTDVLTKKKEMAQKAKNEIKGTVVKIGGEWVAYDELGEEDVSSVPSKVWQKGQNVLIPSVRKDTVTIQLQTELFLAQQLLLVVTSERRTTGVVRSMLINANVISIRTFASVRPLRGSHLAILINAFLIASVHLVHNAKVKTIGVTCTLKARKDGLRAPVAISEDGQTDKDVEFFGDPRRRRTQADLRCVQRDVLHGRIELHHTLRVDDAHL